MERWMVLMNGMMTGVSLDGTKVGNKRVTLRQAHFSPGGLDLGATSSPEWFEWVKMNLDTGAAVNTFDFIKDLGVRRIVSKCDNEPSTKALQDAVIHACVGVEVIPQGLLEGDHMANGRVEMAVRDVKRQCGTLRVSAEHNTGVRIADDSPLLSRLPRFAAQVMNKVRIGKRWKNE